MLVHPVLNVVVLSVIMLNVVILSVIMLSVVPSGNGGGGEGKGPGLCKLSPLFCFPSTLSTDIVPHQFPK